MFLPKQKHILNFSYTNPLHLLNVKDKKPTNRIIIGNQIKIITIVFHLT
ncbi:hypothetical protein BN1221_03439c [Brenneria goodwinii]|uniref:Uncharacterized protein n=1 Tax=Brenneria goodwinii TaxID=1109412 RepID=A0A0G4JZ06_9GAMM|nr:hypothetical protein BN1221_03439c [Brenneria goodwinii]